MKEGIPEIDVVHPVFRNPEAGYQEIDAALLQHAKEASILHGVDAGIAARSARMTQNSRDLLNMVHAHQQNTAKVQAQNAIGY